MIWNQNLLYNKIILNSTLILNFTFFLIIKIEFFYNELDYKKFWKLEIILYFIFRDSTCLSSKTKALIKKFKNQKNEKKDLKTNLKSIRTKNFIITNK
jgi:hypothetical protein